MSSLSEGFRHPDGARNESEQRQKGVFHPFLLSHLNSVASFWVGNNDRYSLRNRGKYQYFSIRFILGVSTVDGNLNLCYTESRSRVENQGRPSFRRHIRADGSGVNFVGAVLCPDRLGFCYAQPAQNGQPQGLPLRFRRKTL